MDTRETKAAMSVSVIVLTYNNYEDTRECLDSLTGLDYGSFEVVVVDNASTDGSVERLERQFPDAVFIRNRANLGYAGGNNVGVMHALERGAEAVWILNNDTVVKRDSLTRLVEAAMDLPDAGILGSVTLYYDAPDEVQFAGGRLVKWQGRGVHLAKGEMEGIHPLEPRETDFVTGASMLVRREMIESVGLLDEAYFLYLEDLDWALRARGSGWKTYLVPGSVVLHKVNRTTKVNRPLIVYYVCRNSLFLCRRHFPCFLTPVLLWCMISYVIAYLVKFLLKGSSGDPLEHMRMGWLGIRDFFARRMGEWGGGRNGRVRTTVRRA
ncbi:MAG: glycosyltransferase family 2 protein [Actinobacteria bacterium]|nr:glycosyltransferase family 2 protein [Actinomycetota bacterium]